MEVAIGLMLVRYSKRSTVTLFLGLFAFFSATVRAQEPQDQEPRLQIQIDVTATIPDDERWLELKSKNFLLVGTVGEADLKKLAADLELIRETFSQYFPRARERSSVPTTVVVFRHTPSYRWFLPEDEDISERAKGYLRPGIDTHYLVLNSDSIARELYRDYLRTVIQDAMPPVPLWFREGLADYFSALRINRFVFGDRRWLQLGDGIGEYDRRLDKKAALLPFEQLFRLHEESPEYVNDDTRVLVDAESWALVHFMMSRPRGASSMMRLFNLIGEGVSFDDGIRQAFGVNRGRLEDDFRRYVRDSQREHLWSGSVQMLTRSEREVAKGECGKLLMPAMIVPRLRQCYWGDDPDPPGVARVPYSFDKTWAEVLPLRARAMSEAEAWFYRGDLMSHIGRLGEAKAYLERSVEQLPQSSQARTALGVVQIRQKRYADAEASLKAAIETDPKNFLGHFYSAVLIRERGKQNPAPSYDDLEDIHDTLLKVLSLAPQFTEAAEMLAEINRLRHTEAGEAQRFLLDALKRSPGKNSIWVALASNAVQNSDPGSARWLLNRVLAAGAPDANSRKLASTLLDGVAPGAARAPMATAVAVANPDTLLRATNTERKAATSTGKIATEKVRGLLTEIDCRNGLTLTMKAGGRTVKFHAKSPFSVDFIARDRDDRAVSAGPVICGPLPDDGVEVQITYRPDRSGDSIGEPAIVEIRIAN